MEFFGNFHEGSKRKPGKAYLGTIDDQAKIDRKKLEDVIIDKALFGPRLMNKINDGKRTKLNVELFEYNIDEKGKRPKKRSLIESAEKSAVKEMLNEVRKEDRLKGYKNRVSKKEVSRPTPYMRGPTGLENFNKLDERLAEDRVPRTRKRKSPSSPSPPSPSIPELYDGDGGGGGGGEDWDNGNEVDTGAQMLNEFGNFYNLDDKWVDVPPAQPEQGAAKKRRKNRNKKTEKRVLTKTQKRRQKRLASKKSRKSSSPAQMVSEIPLTQKSTAKSVERKPTAKMERKRKNIARAGKIAVKARKKFESKRLKNASESKALHKRRAMKRASSLFKGGY